MSTDREELRSFLEGGTCSSETVGRVMGVLEPLFMVADTGYWSLEEKETFEDPDMSALMIDVISASLQRIHGGKIVCPVTDVTLMSISEYRTAGNRIKGELDIVTWGSSLSAQIYMTYCTELDGDVYVEVDVAVAENIFRSLGQVRVSGEVIQDRWPMVWTAVKDVIFFYVGLAYVDNISALNKIEGLVKGLQFLLPAGFLKDAPGNLAILTK
jgi:hypothetical protein